MMVVAAAAGLRRVVGFDFGTKRIGAAVGQEATRSATPLCTLTTVRGGPDWQGIAEIVAEWRPDRLVVGRPVQADGSVGAVARASERFVTKLEALCALPVDTVDERLSSHEAEARLRSPDGAHSRSRAGVDAMAACLILETWFSIAAGDDDRPE